MNYLYNGVELPALPEWDKEKYPYAFIFDDVEEYYMALFMQDVVYESDPGSSLGDYLVGSHKQGFWYMYDGSGDEWGWGLAHDDSIGVIFDVKKVLWANFDVLNEDGTVCLTASDPIPVTTEPIDPTSLLMGYRVGQMIRGMRNQPKEDV